MNCLQEIVESLPLLEKISAGKRVRKCKPSGAPKLSNAKPFKSGEMVNTVKGVILHPQLGIPAYTFEEDESYVECRRCQFVEE